MSAGPVAAEGRVATVQRQTRATFALVGIFALAALAAVVVPHRTGRWLPLHLFLAGALLLAISGAAQLFAVTWAAGPPPSARLAAAQRGLLAAGAAGVAFGRELRAPDVVTGAAGGAVVAALALLAVMLWQTVSHGVQRRFDPSLRAYLAALGLGVIGCSLGVALVTGHAGSAEERIRSAHLTLNLLGLLGIVIAGTLPFFAATEARVKMSRRATTRTQTGVLLWLALATVVAAVGLLADSAPIATVGLVFYVTGIAGVVALLPGVGRKQLRWGGPRLLQLGAGIGWWAGAVAAAAWQTARGAEPFGGPALLVLVVGGYAQILVAALAYLVPVLRGGGHERLTAGFRLTRSWIGLLAANAAAVAIVLDVPTVAIAAAALWAFDTAVREAMLLAAP
ncbi:MAG: hypothetical protein U0V73_05530 [Acidimicrobiia bacterium]